MSEARAFLADLRREIEAHPGVNHLFLSRLSTTPFARADYKVFGENHYPLVCVFTSYLERLLVRAPDSEAKLWLAKVLIDTRDVVVTTDSTAAAEVGRATLMEPHHHIHAARPQGRDGTRRQLTSPAPGIPAQQPT